MILRFFYSLVFYSSLPLIVGRLLWRSVQAPAYRERVAERFGFYRYKPDHPVLWFHAVSVGEAEAAFPLIKRIQSEFPRKKILVTTTTPTGSARVRAVLGDSVEHVYLPYDVPDAIARFFASFRPELAVIMETEIWPNLFTACAAADIPLFIVNARLSEKSARGYRKIPLLIEPALSCVSGIAAQTQQDADRFVAIGANPGRVQTVGNLKFDLDVDRSLFEQGQRIKRQLFADRFVWIIASTHKDEESLFLSLYPELKAAIPDLLMVIVPRHPERFAEVGRLLKDCGLQFSTRSSGLRCFDETDVYLLDTIGELKLFYTASDLAFVGGSMVRSGGHNILEPAALGVPVMFGPYMDNFSEIAAKVLSCHAALQCSDRDDIAKAVLDLYRSPTRRGDLIDAGSKFVASNKGALEQIAQMLIQKLH
ncbi:MAG: lipid IV(A) 3-deoxy-D-manno-octulosonic acid transferase [Methylomicrobium sp.]